MNIRKIIYYSFRTGLGNAIASTSSFVQTRCIIDEYSTHKLCMYITKFRAFVACGSAAFIPEAGAKVKVALYPVLCVSRFPKYFEWQVSFSIIFITMPIITRRLLRLIASINFHYFFNSNVFALVFCWPSIFPRMGDIIS